MANRSRNEPHGHGSVNVACSRCWPRSASAPPALPRPVSAARSAPDSAYLLTQAPQSLPHLPCRVACCARSCPMFTRDSRHIAASRRSTTKLLTPKRLGASPPTSPSCRSCCGIRSHDRHTLEAQPNQRESARQARSDRCRVSPPAQARSPYTSTSDTPRPRHPHERSGWAG
jgi:hypothetical protein